MSTKRSYSEAYTPHPATYKRLAEDSIRVRAVIDSMGEGLIVTDERGTITAVNPYALKALGYEEQEILGRWLPRTIIAVNENGKPLDGFSRPIFRALTEGAAVSARGRYVRKDGRVIPVQLTVSPVIIEGRPSGAIELFRDITEEKQLDIAKDEFVSLASHQLRTPASGVEAVLSMLLSGDLGPLTPDQHKYIGKAAESNRRQLRIIEDILSTAQIDAGKMELELEVIDIIPILKSTVSEHQLALTAKNHAIILDLPEKLQVCVDKNKIHMVLDNLLSNATKYTHEGGTITVRAMKRDGFAELAISDNGVGISRENAGALFTKFARFPNQLTAIAGGTGLGLYLAKNIVNLHKGDIIVESKPKRGTTFRVILPNQ